ncbi:putative T7SS-secreted protein [Streptomyces lincolnensis]|uniref:putative T7SS-secreted protein n=1 Tax=Streptomyces lincolnensis TaxID=1915 RepID=UPI0037D64DBA
MAAQTFEALGFDPAPGVPDVVASLATALAKVDRQLHDTHQTLGSLKKREGIWHGEAATLFAGKLGELPRHLSNAHQSLATTTGALHRWQTELRELQAKAASYEHDAQEAGRRVRQAEGNPDLKLAGRTFDTDAGLHEAQSRLDTAERELSNAREELQTVIDRAERLRDHHAELAEQIAKIIEAAADRAPDQGLLSKLADMFSGVIDQLTDLAKEIYRWAKDHADLIYEIGDWLGYASAACDVLAAIFSETIIGAVVFEAIGMVLNAGALTFHAGGWALGSKKGNWMDIGLDVVGFVPFGDFARFGKVGLGAFKGVKIPMEVLEAGPQAFRSLERADDIVAAVGGTARKEITDVVSRNWAAGGRQINSVLITADTFKDRLGVSIARHLGDASLYKTLSPFTPRWRALNHLGPEIIERTPLKNIPALADSVKTIRNEAGETVSKFIDPTSWTARGARVLTESHNLYKEGVRTISEPVQYESEKIHEKVAEARAGLGHTIDSVGRAVSAAHPFG